MSTPGHLCIQNNRGFPTHFYILQCPQSLPTIHPRNAGHEGEAKFNKPFRLTSQGPHSLPDRLQCTVTVWLLGASALCQFVLCGGPYQGLAGACRHIYIHHSISNDRESNTSGMGTILNYKTNFLRECRYSYIIATILFKKKVCLIILSVAITVPNLVNRYLLKLYIIALTITVWAQAILLYSWT